MLRVCLYDSKMDGLVCVDGDGLGQVSPHCGCGLPFRELLRGYGFGAGVLNKLKNTLSENIGHQGYPVTHGALGSLYMVNKGVLETPGISLCCAYTM